MTAFENRSASASRSTFRASARKRLAPAAALTALALGLSACSVADQGGGEKNGAGEGGKGSKGTVTIMTHDSFALPDELVQKFEDESGYTLKTTAPGDAGAVVNQLLMAKDDPTVDGVYGVENHSTHRLIEEDAVAEFTPEDLPDSAEDEMVDGRMTPIDQGQVCVNVDPAWFEEHGIEAPTSIDQLTEPEYAKRLVVTSPVSSSPGLAFLAATVEKEGEDGWQDWWRQLLENDAKVAESWSDAYNSDFSAGEGEGDYPLVLSYSSSPAFLPETEVIEDSCTPQVEYAGVVEGAQNPEGAEAFIEFMLSEDVQTAVPEALYMYPIDESVELPTEWEENAPLVEDPIEPDSQEVAENREQWLKDWNALHEGA